MLNKNLLFHSFFDPVNNPKLSWSFVTFSNVSMALVRPNAMQEIALKNLKKTREQGEERAVIIAATGTGKTYLAAFDFSEYQPKKYLFIARAIKRYFFG